MRGVTFLELLIAIAITVVVLTILTASFLILRVAGQLPDSQSQIIGLLREARSRTLASVGNTTYGVHFEESRAVLFRGTSFSPSNPYNEVYLLPTSLKISAIKLGGGEEVVFQRLSGNPSVSGTIRIEAKSDSSRSRTVTILASGNVE